jgi:hypothetical protein
MANTKIIDLVHAKTLSMQENLAEAGVNGTLAIAAIKAGLGSPAWRAYMKQFVEQSPPGTIVDQRQLDRLMGTDETKDDPDMDRKRAYLVGNGLCMDFTPTGLPSGVQSIDDGIESNCVPRTPRPPRPRIRKMRRQTRHRASKPPYKKR